MIRRCLFAILTCSTLIVSDPLAKTVVGQQGGPDRPEGIQVLTRGPVHEAFAETVSYDPKPGILVKKEPPAVIEERPPDQKPEGAHVIWIPGYWAWDDERVDFIWISGLWRNVPPGRQWVPGYWAATDGGWQWTAGYWANADQTEVVYVPAPPATLEAGPNAPAPSSEDMWVPGYWSWEDGRYVWIPGFWRHSQPTWLWVPAHYVWTPQGCLFSEGYWDYPIAARGVLFAPIFFEQPRYASSGFHFSPAIVIAADLLADHLFCRPSYCHYYFGDYYATQFASIGIYPWFTFHHSGYGYDPIFAYQRWQHRQDDVNWEQRVQTNFRNRQQNVSARPPHTLAQFKQQLADGLTPAGKHGLLAMPLVELAKRPESALRLQPLDHQERRQIAQATQEAHEFRQQRQKLETHGAANLLPEGAASSGPAKAIMPRSPLRISPTESRTQNEGVRPPHVTLKPVLPAEGKPAPSAAPQPLPRQVPPPMPRPEFRSPPKAEPVPAPRLAPIPRGERASRSGGEKRRHDKQ